MHAKCPSCGKNVSNLELMTKPTWDANIRCEGCGSKMQISNRWWLFLINVSVTIGVIQGSWRLIEALNLFDGFGLNLVLELVVLGVVFSLYFTIYPSFVRLKIC